MCNFTGGKGIESGWNSMSSTCANSQQEARLERVKFSGSFELHL